jgi:hypothetical protein
MPRKAVSRPATVSRSRLVAAADLSSDDDFAHTQATMLPSPDSSDIKVAAPPPPRSRSNKAAAAAAPRAPKTASAAPDARNRKRARAALADLTNVPDGSEPEAEPEPERKRARPAATTTTAATKKSKSRQPTAARRGRKAEPAPVEEEQEPEEDVHASVEQIDESVEESHIAPLRTVAPPQAAAAYPRARSSSRQPEPVAIANSVRRRRAGSASSTERAGLGDPALRRRLGELQNKFEAQQIKYQNLKDVATTEAQTNFERLKSASDAKAKCELASVSPALTNLAL